MNVQKWENRVIYIPDDLVEQVLDQHGALGWEPWHVKGTSYWLKRPVDEPEANTPYGTAPGESEPKDESLLDMVTRMGRELFEPFT